MPKNSLNVSLKGADDIFSTEESRQEQQREQVQQIPIGVCVRSEIAVAFRRIGEFDGSPLGNGECQRLSGQVGPFVDIDVESPVVVDSVGKLYISSRAGIDGRFHIQRFVLYAGAQRGCQQEAR